MSADSQPQYDCCKCGSCCCDGWDVLLYPYDVERFERRPDLVKLTISAHTAGYDLRFMLKGADGKRCIALEGEIGNVRCTIHADRPFLCRAFEMGSPECIESRQRRGLPT